MATITIRSVVAPLALSIHTGAEAYKKQNASC